MRSKPPHRDELLIGEFRAICSKPARTLDDERRASEIVAEVQRRVSLAAIRRKLARSSKP